MALLQLGDAGCQIELLDDRFDTQLLCDGLADVYFVAHHLAGLWIDEAERLAGAVHANDQLAFFLDIGQLVCIRSTSHPCQTGHCCHPHTPFHSAPCHLYGSECPTNAKNGPCVSVSVLRTL